MWTRTALGILGPSTIPGLLAIAVGLSAGLSGACGGRTPLEGAPGNRGPGDGGPIPIDQRPGPGLDASADAARDTGPARDGQRDVVGPSDGPLDGAGDAGLGRYLAYEPAPYTGIELRNCSVTSGQTAFVRVLVGIFDVCQRPGPALLAQGKDSFGVYFPQAFVWAEKGGECAPVTDRGERDVALRLGEGRWSFRSDDGQSAVLTVQPPPPPVTCTDPGGEGASCQVDCDCTEGRPCIAYGGDSVCSASCATPCSESLDCLPGQLCSADASLATGTCESQVDDACGSDDDCERQWPRSRCVSATPGRPRSCGWAGPFDRLGKACGDHRDCGESLPCVEVSPGERRCEVPCITSVMRCPLTGYVCPPGSAGQAPVCLPLDQ